VVASRVPAFDDLLYSLVKAKGLSLREFAARVGQAHTVFSMIRAGTRPVPMEHVPVWADALDLPEGSAERDRFFDLAALTHVPSPEARVRLERMLVRMDDLAVKHSALRRLFDEQQARTPRTPPPVQRHPTPPPKPR